MKPLLAALLALGAACATRPPTSAQPAPTQPTATPPAPAGPSVTVFADEFSDPALDRAKWNVEVTGQWVNDEQQAYIDAPDVIRIVHGAEAEGATDGALLIEAHPRPAFVTAEGRRFDFVSGRINTRNKMEFAYGTAAARIRMSAGTGLWPAFWALGTGGWPDTGEIDIMENVGEPTWMSAALHGPGYSGNTPLVSRYFYGTVPNATEWHVYAVDWSAAELVFRVDETVVYRVTRAMIEQYGRFAFDNPKFLILNLALGGGYPASTSGVKAPYFGLPQSTVDQIRTGHAHLLVDWVHVTRTAAAQR